MAGDVDGGRVVPLNPGGGAGGGGGHGERLARIEAKMEYMATREDVAEVKTLIEREVGEVKTLIERKETTMLRWLCSMVVVAIISLVAALVRTFF